MPEKLYKQIINARLDYLDDINIKPLGKGNYLLSRYGVGNWYWLDICAHLPMVNTLLDGYRQLTTETPFTGEWAYRKTIPDEITFKDWLRIYYNELECHAAYKSEEEKAYQTIIGFLIGGDITTIKDLRLELGSLCTDDETTAVQFDIYDSLVSVIADYLDEQEKGGNHQ